MQERPFRITSGYLVAVALIFTVTACAWLVLGRVTDSRTEDRDASLRSEVSRLWGGSHNHLPPSVVLVAQSATPASQPAAATPAPAIPEACLAARTAELLRTRASVDLGLDHRRKGLLWYSTYTVAFDGMYTVENATPCARRAQVWIPFPARGVAYDEFSLQLDGAELPLEISSENQQAASATAVPTLSPGRHELRLRYRSRGMDRWNYSFGAHTARARDFQLAVRTDFAKVDFPGGGLSPTHKRETDKGWELTWRFGNLLSEAGIAVGMPQKINPGPLAAQISKFAPVSLAFFFFLLLLLSVLRAVRLHPVHYAMLAAAFFSFHLLLVYSVDLIPLPVAFAIASVVSVGLVTSYLRLAVGPRFALLWAGGLQALYLVLFSLAFFLEGYTGITITLFSILTLFVVMQLTGRIDWAAKFGGGERPQRGPTAHRAAPLGPPAASKEPAAAGNVFSHVG
jgi:hypothetical protein